MEISRRFRRDLGYYMLGVIVPGAINAVIVPLLKKLLGASTFGIYGIRYNFMLLLAAFSVGWLCQSVIRFKFAAAGDEHDFYRRILGLGSRVVGGIGLLSFCISYWYYHSGLIFSLLFAGCFVFCGFQNLLISISQSNFLSRFTMYSEAIRTGVFFILALLLLQTKTIPPVYSLFTALGFSYLISSVLLFRKNKLWAMLHQKTQSIKGFKISQVFHYGIPLAIWYLLSNLVMFLDKPLLAEKMGHEVQGHYQALYELINKGAVVLLIPVLYALFPLLSNAFENNDEKTAMRLLKKIILIELGILIAGLLAYWWFGFIILQYVLSVPNTMDYKWCGFFMLASVMSWQIGMLVQKPFELRKQTKMLLWIVLAALVVFLAMLYWVGELEGLGPYRFTLPFLAASVTYVFICLLALGHIRKMGAQITDTGKLIWRKLSG